MVWGRSSCDMVRVDEWTPFVTGNGMAGSARRPGGLRVQ